MGSALKKRVARLEGKQLAHGDWRQFGSDPCDMPDWALVASVLWHYEQDPKLGDNPRVKEVRRLYDSGDMDAAFQALGSMRSGSE